MRKRFYLALAVLASLVGCQEEMESPEIDSLIAGADSFYAEIVQPGNTKTYIDDFLNVRFQKEDQIAIFNNSTLADKYKIEDSADGKTSGTFNKVIEQGGDSFDVGAHTNAIVAYYPYTTLELDATSVEKGNYILKGIFLPSTQTYDPTHLVAQNALPMLSAKTDNDRRITFKNICGVLKFNIKGYGSIKQIAFKGNGNEKISGKAAVSIKPNEMPLIAMDETAGSEVILNCGETGVALDPDTPKSFMIVLPPMAFQQGFELTITDTEGGSMVKKTTTSKEIKRSTILNMKDAFTFGKKPDTPAPTPGATIPNNEIWYTTTDNVVITPENTSSTCFGANLTHNVYENGKGVMTFDGDVTMIGNIAFEACPTLTKIALPSTVTSIGTLAFDNCRSLAEAYIPAVSASGSEGMFNQNIKLIVIPTGRGEQYQSAEFWSAYSSKIVEYDYSAALPVIYTYNIPTGVHERGGLESFDYFVASPGLESSTVEATADVPWIQNLRINDGRVFFDVQANVGGLTRDAIITLTYPNANPVNVIIHHLCFQPSMVVTLRGVEIPMIKVEGGTFMMGATPEQGDDAKSDEKPAHQVTLSDYYIGQTEVTQELWEAVMGSLPSLSDRDPKYPMISVSWNDIVNDFLPKLNSLTGKNFTLPTEAQWEFAARGGNKSKGYKYSGSDDVGEVANYYLESLIYQYLSHVGSYLPNELGIYNMSGNASEWCSDWKNSYLSEVQTDPIGPDSSPAPYPYRVLRGGNNYSKANDCRVSSRECEYPWNKQLTGQHGELGFRLAMSGIVSMKQETLELLKGQSEKLIIYSNGVVPVKNGLIWNSSDPSVASVDSNGKVSAVGVGSAVITAVMKDTGKEMSCKVSVIAPIEPSMIISANGVDIPLIKVDGGTFTMGATPEQGSEAESDEKPAHQVTLSDYYIGQTEVTQELWEAVMGLNPSNNKGNPKYPVENVSWNDIVNDFLPKLNAQTGQIFTLPTEAQWEFAARGGNKSKSCKYSGSNNIDDVAWYVKNSESTIHPVGSKLHNELGLYDMSGNVQEWCSDWFDSYSAEAQTDPLYLSPNSYPVSRGGDGYNDAFFCRISGRTTSSPESRTSYHGFRLAISNIFWISETRLKLSIGKSQKLSLKSNGVLPLINGLTWTSSDPNVATVSSNGEVIARNAGYADITVRVDATGKEMSCEVCVIAHIEPSMIISANGVDIPLIKVDGGTFTMGATPEQGSEAESDEKPAHQVTLSDYYIGQTEVTQELWEAVMGSNPSFHKGNPKYPVENVSWDLINNDFLPKLNKMTGKTFTLPTEAQWEFAARGGNNSKGYKYSGSNYLDDVAWYEGNSSRTSPAGNKISNHLGLYDMSGNVLEWCSDWYGTYSDNAQTDPTGPKNGQYRVLRGGAQNDEARHCRVTSRRYADSNYVYFGYGFRLALPAEKH